MGKTEQEYAKSSFSDVALQYDQLAFFKRSAEKVVQLLQNEIKEQPARGLDVACGTGNVILTCAKHFPKTQFDAVDLSQDMLDQAKNNATASRIDNIHFKLADVTQITAELKYDVITCSYALFFLPNPDKVLNRLYQKLKKGGLLLFTSFQAEAFSPTQKIILSLLRDYGSNSAIEYDENHWQILKTSADINYLCQKAEVPKPEIVEAQIRYPMTLDQWWHLLNNTGYKGMLLEIDVVDLEKLKQDYFTQMQAFQDNENNVELIADSFFTIIRKS